MTLPPFLWRSTRNDGRLSRLFLLRRVQKSFFQREATTSPCRGISPSEGCPSPQPRRREVSRLRAEKELNSGSRTGPCRQLFYEVDREKLVDVRHGAELPPITTISGFRIRMRFARPRESVPRILSTRSQARRSPSWAAMNTPFALTPRPSPREHSMIVDP